MKVGTDGVLLGAWAPADGNPGAILDIGAGTGLVALMLAQRCPTAQVDAVEIEAAAFEQCTENFEASPWPDRLFCYHASLEAFAAEFGPDYDLVVSNPPFHAETVGSAKADRERARRQSSLPYGVLLECVSKLMAPGGRFCAIIPFKDEAAFCAEGVQYGLLPVRITRVRGTPGSETKRSLVCLGSTPTDFRPAGLTIADETGRYTPQYVALTRDFYLNM